MGRNQAMRRKVNKGMAVDIGGYPKDEHGRFILPDGIFQEGADLDYCDMRNDAWVWSIGRRKADGVVLASVKAFPEFYQNPEFDCLWLR